MGMPFLTLFLLDSLHEQHEDEPSDEVDATADLQQQRQELSRQELTGRHMSPGMVQKGTDQEAQLQSTGSIPAKAALPQGQHSPRRAHTWQCTGCPIFRST